MKISVITVSYNSFDTIRDTLESVKLQSYNDIEYIVIDGGSTDGTLEVIRKYDAIVNIIKSEPDSGIYDAMNKGLSVATGEIIGFLNSDDFFADKDVLKRIAKAFTENSVDACYGDLLYLTHDAKRIVRYWKSREFKIGDFALGWSPPHPTFYIRRALLKKMGDFDRSYKLSADAEFMMRYLENGEIRSYYIPTVQVHMRVGGATNKSWLNIIQQNKEILHALKKNGVRYLPIIFCYRKILDRVSQRILGILKNHKTFYEIKNK